ncbi:SIMPL domain-containing protein [Sphingomicrobium sp. XHP0239]|uniref:SIMPL domain-containing protein n=1 Tax=Sphingomicrobium maritimum TaxID=3133972 RepID=UPI0031CC716A
MTNRTILALALGAACPAVLAVPAAAQVASPVTVQPVTIDINATGTVDAVPDLAIVNAGVEVRAPTAAAALREASDRIEAILGALEAAGVEDRDIQTSRVSLNPQFDYSERSEPRLTGYAASNTVNVRFRDIERAGTIVDALVQAGANQVNGPSFTFADPDPLTERARMEALRMGEERARAYAAALGKRDVRLVYVSEGVNGMAPPPVPMAMAEQSITVTGARKVPLRPGEQEIGVGLSMRYELR